MSSQSKISRPVILLLTGKVKQGAITLAMHAAKIDNSPRLQKLVAALADGNWHSTAELSNRCNNYAVGTSISELRSNGLEIDARRIKADQGEDYWEYRQIKEAIAQQSPRPVSGAEPDYLYEERLAIMIHDGGLELEDAERRAWICCYHKTEMYQKRDGSVEFRHTLVAPKPPAPQKAPVEEIQSEMSFEEFSALARRRFHYE